VYYANGEIPMRGDRIENDAGRLGTVLEVQSDSEKAIIKWDHGVVGITHTIDNHIRLISRLPSSLSFLYVTDAPSSAE
jgi:hypothetical protein